jgi:hypothetical protein
MAVEGIRIVGNGRSGERERRGGKRDGESGRRFAASLHGSLAGGDGAADQPLAMDESEQPGTETLAEEPAEDQSRKHIDILA